VKLSERIGRLLAFPPALALWALYGGYYSTVRRKVINDRYAPGGAGMNGNAVYVFWHSKTFLAVPFGRSRRVGILTLLDWKNLIYDQICRLYGYQTVPVRSRGAAAVRLRELLEKGKGLNVVLALDGPKGPAGVIKPGALYLAAKTGRPIVCVSIRLERSLRIRSRWDRFEIPLPFTRAVGTFHEPFHVLDGGWEEARQRIRQELGDP
jgi:lysophospholipid acyltransferase (LPLAT)-like uncharacterized protein